MSDPATSLTPREQQILHEISSDTGGKGVRKRVARKLGISHHTVATVCARAKLKIRLGPPEINVRIGRPRAPEAYTSLNVYLYERHVEWLRRQPGNASQVLRKLLDETLSKVESCSTNETG
jgi:hypothetical protein